MCTSKAPPSVRCTAHRVHCHNATCKARTSQPLRALTSVALVFGRAAPRRWVQRRYPTQSKQPVGAQAAMSDATETHDSSTNPQTKFIADFHARMQARVRVRRQQLPGQLPQRVNWL